MSFWHRRLLAVPGAVGALVEGENENAGSVLVEAMAHAGAGPGLAGPVFDAVPQAGILARNTEQTALLVHHQDVVIHMEYIQIGHHGWLIVVERRHWRHGQSQTNL